MFSQEELKLIDPEYFTIIDHNETSLTLVSKNTGLRWHLLTNDNNKSDSIAIYRTHYIDMAYIFHRYAINLTQALLFIKNHDKSQITFRQQMHA